MFELGSLEGFRNEPPTHPGDTLYMLGWYAGQGRIGEIQATWEQRDLDELA
jgi:hypothetical protein